MVPRLVGGRGIVGWLILVVGLLVFFVVTVTAPHQPCTEADPCGPDPGGNLLVGVMLAVPLLGWCPLWLAAGAAVAMTGGLLWYDLARSDHSSPPWVHVLVAVFAAGCVLLARLDGRRTRRRGARWAMSPSVGWWPRPLWVLVACVLVAAGLACASWAVVRQIQVDAQTRHANNVAAIVRAHPAASTLMLAFPDGHTENMSVYEAADYPIGSPLRVAVDDHGLRQLHAEPYDASPWWAPAIGLVLLGVGLWWRLAATPADRPARCDRPARRLTTADGWPVPGRVETNAGVAVILAGGVAGIAASEPALRAIVEVVCTVDGCNRAAMGAVGWALPGVPLLLSFGVYRLARPSRLAWWALVMTVALLSLGVGTMAAFITQGVDAAERAAEITARHPEVALLVPGFMAGATAVTLGAVLDRGLGRQFSHDVRQRPYLPLLVVVGAQGVALIAVMIWAALSG